MRVRKTVSASAAVAGVALAGLAMPAVAQAAPVAQQATQQTAAADKPIPGTKCDPQARACLSLSKNKAWLIKNGKISYGPVPITSGKPGQETPVGMHHVLWEDIDHWSKAYNAPMPWSVFFTNSGIAFHEGDLNEQSNGCVHLSEKAAATFYNALQPGDPVHVTP